MHGHMNVKIYFVRNVTAANGHEWQAMCDVSEEPYAHVRRTVPFHIL